MKVAAAIATSAVVRQVAMRGVYQNAARTWSSVNP